MFGQGGRQDLVDKEQAALAVLQEYMPEQMTADEIENLARQVIQDVGAAGPGDRGRVMGRIMPQVRGKGGRQRGQCRRFPPVGISRLDLPNAFRHPGFSGNLE